MTLGLAALLNTAAAHDLGTHTPTPGWAPSAHGKLYFEREGHGPAVVLVAGGPGASHSSFHDNFSQLADRFTLIYLDNIGRGQSDKLADPRGYTVERDAEDIEAVRRHLGLERISVIGHSYGAMVALRYAVQQPGHVSHLVLGSTPLDAAHWQAAIEADQRYAQTYYPDVWRRAEQLKAQGTEAARAQAEAVLDQLPDRSWFDPANPKKRWNSKRPEDKLSLAVYDAIAGERDGRLTGTVLSYRPFEQLERLSAPVLLCAGRHDPVAPPSTSYELYDRLKPGTATVRIFEKSSHRPWVEESDAYLQAVGAFLAK